MGFLTDNKYNKLSIGLLVGLIGPMIGLMIYGLYYSGTNDVSLGYFLNNFFFGNRMLVAPILSLSLLFNILPFYFFLNRQHYIAGRGILLSFFLYAIVIVYFRFF